MRYYGILLSNINKPCNDFSLTAQASLYRRGSGTGCNPVVIDSGGSTPSRRTLEGSGDGPQTGLNPVPREILRVRFFYLPRKKTTVAGWQSGLLRYIGNVVRRMCLRGFESHTRCHTPANGFGEESSKLFRRVRVRFPNGVPNLYGPKDTTSPS